MTAIAPRDRYRRLDLLGRGGMGEVFLADDLLLRRKVAIKVVHKTALSNPRAEKLLRREAKAAAALDNPFICKVYEVGEEDGRVFIAMEYIQGETLRQRMMRGSIPIREVVSLAREMADGLDESSRQRVIHRDLKPSNIIITPQGHVKIMDFGLAKRLPGEESGEESTGTPEGMVVGTREYMSPEQLRGKPLEPSSDLFPFGLMLYEMLGGLHPFKKAAPIDTQFAILNETAPDLLSLRPDTPEDLADLIDDLLIKSPVDRPRIGEVRQRLADVSESARPEPKERTRGASSSVEAFVARKPRVILSVGVALLLLVIALSLWVSLRPEPTMPQARMTTLVSWPSTEEQASLSPDAKNVSFISNRDGVRDIWVMDLQGGEPRRLTRAPGNLTAQVFSEDGTEIGYTLESETQKLFQSIRLDGGPPTRSFSLPEATRVRRMIRWVGKDVFLETQYNAELARLSLSTGDLTILPTLPRLPQRPAQYDVSRDGQEIAFSALNDDGSRSVWIQSPGQPAHSITRPGSNHTSPFFSNASGKGRLFFESDRSGQEDLWFIESPGREPRQITFGSNREFMESVSADGTTIVFSEVLEGGSIFSVDLRNGERAQLTAENMRDVTPALSRSGRVAFGRTPLSSRRPTESSSILIGTLSEGHLQDVRVAVREGFGPLLSPDGRWLAFMTGGGTAAPHMNLLEVETGHVADLGEKPMKSLAYMESPWSFSKRDYAWMADGALVFTQGPDTAGARIVRVEPGQTPTTLSQLQAGETGKQFVSSPDGSSLFFVSTNREDVGGVLLEVRKGQTLPGLIAPRGALALLGFFHDALLVAEQPSLDGPILVKSVVHGVVKEVMHFEGALNSLRLVRERSALAFSRRDARDVENIHLKSLETGKETLLTKNGIQGVAFSPVADSGSDTLVFSQQLRNKDLGIIRLDRR